MKTLKPKFIEINEICWEFCEYGTRCFVFGSRIVVTVAQINTHDILCFNSCLSFGGNPMGYTLGGSLVYRKDNTEEGKTPTIYISI